MKTRPVLLIGFLAALISIASADDKDAVKKDLAQLKGEWLMVSGSADGMPMPDNLRKQMKRVCTEDAVTVMMGDRVFLKAKVTIDPTKTRKTIDYEMLDGFTKGKRQLGIYELEGDTFKSCFAAPGADRPADFTTKEGDKRTVSVWKKKSEAPDK
jgi:uncharacterized protein (TIGR03067 family)